MRAFKFVVPGDRYYPLPSDPDLAFKGCAAVVLAATEDEARRMLAESGDDTRWLAVARVESYPVDAQRLLLFVML
jgi:hypothetical protein